MADNARSNLLLSLAKAVQGQQGNVSGKNGVDHAQDTRIIHAMPGEVVLPPLNTLPPEFVEMLKSTVRDLSKRTVGHPATNKNPMSGFDAFFVNSKKDTVTVPRTFGKGEHEVHVAFITPKEMELLKLADIHNSKPPHPGPSGVPNFNSGGGAGDADDSDVGGGEEADTGGFGGTPSSSQSSTPSGEDIGEETFSAGVQAGNVGGLSDPAQDEAGQDTSGGQTGGSEGSGIADPAEASASLAEAAANAIGELEENEIGKVIGSIIGGIVGSPIGPVGSAIGSAIGGKIGASIGTSPQGKTNFGANLGFGKEFGGIDTGLADLQGFDLGGFGDLGGDPGGATGFGNEPTSPGDNIGPTGSTDLVGVSTEAPKAEAEKGEGPSIRDLAPIDKIIDQLFESDEFDRFATPERRADVHEAQALFGFPALAAAAVRRG